MRHDLTRGQFNRLVRAYRPSPYDAFGAEDSRFSRPMNHALKNRDRLHVALRSGLQRLPDGPSTIVDFGPFPGSLLRLLRGIEPTRAARLFGAGLMASPEFVQFMKQDAGVEIFTVNLDPAGQQFTSKGYQVQVPLPEGSVHLIFALEIVEHLISPFHLMTEAYRLLAPGGHLVITTPNVTRIGNVFKLLAGRSPNDRLAPPGYDNPNDEWRPHAREYAMSELAEMLRHSGFEVAATRFFLGDDTKDSRKTARQRAIDWAKVLFYLVPHLRGSLLIVGRKP
ncbi:MAG: class I SAM-dependent methyltransferase [Nitrospira sp.]|nr:class I SAM-dependent methyltransferase [Nitrospira sp.]